MTRQQILETLEQTICKDRQETYGTPEDSLKNIRDYWHLYLTQIQRPLESHDIAIMMLLLKVARIVKSPQHLDNWVDVARYAICGGELVSTKTEPMCIQADCNTKEEFILDYYQIIFDEQWEVWGYKDGEKVEYQGCAPTYLEARSSIPLDKYRPM